MKKLLIGTLAIALSTFGFQKLADTLDRSIKDKAVESERTVATHRDDGGMSAKGSDKHDDKGKRKA